MFSDKVFQIAFLISLITHGIVLFHNANLNLFTNNKKEEQLEVSYIKKPKEEQFLKLPAKITSKKRTPPPFIDKQSFFKKSGRNTLSESTLVKPIFIKSDIATMKKKITLPPIDIGKINNPSYISYYQIVREKIKRAAYQNYSRSETGEVYLSFIISNGGYLEEIRLSEEKSSSNSYLREVALRSVKNASPFPDFPKELDYPELSFNVVISFEIE